MINVTKTFLPPFEEYTAVLKRAWDKGWITNDGELVNELEQKIKSYLNVEHLLFCGNGTIVLQMALKAFNITKEIITTPFSYVATVNAVLWEGCTPVFVDIDEKSFCIDADKIEASITENTEAILATHVYGLPCNIEKIQTVAKKYNLKVIYDGAHAFGCIYRGKSLLDYGDASTCSFHATKLFHTVEGGCIITHNSELNRELFLYRSFGHSGDEYFSIGINAKNSEFHAAMGLAILPNVNSIIAARKIVFEIYNKHLSGHVKTPCYCLDEFEYNFSYYPVIFDSERSMLAAKQQLMNQHINARRYFYPSLNTVPQTRQLKSNCPISEDISSRVLCLPLYTGLKESEIGMISSIIKASVK